MIIGLDMDGVICRTAQERNVKRVNDTFGTNYRAYDDMHPAHEAFYDSCWEHPTLYDFDIIENEDMRVIEELRRMGRVIVVTAPMAGHIGSKYKFLAHYFSTRDIYICKDKSLVAADVLVDDHQKNIITFPGLGILYDAPWNQGIPGPRVHSFSEIPDCIRHHYLLV